MPIRSVDLIRISIRSYRNFWLSMMVWRSSKIFFTEASLRHSWGFVGGGGGGEIFFTAFKTSKFISVSRDEVGVDVAITGGDDELSEEDLEKESGAAFRAAALLRCSSKSLQRVVRISTVSASSFFSAATFVSSILHASRSTFIFSFSNSSGVSARVVLTFLVCLDFEGTGGAVDPVERPAEAVVEEVIEVIRDDET